MKLAYRKESGIKDFLCYLKETGHYSNEGLGAGERIFSL